MNELPHGTVTLLFTDIEGSTQLQHRLGELYQEVVAEHRRLLEEAFAAHRGVVVDRQTESFFVAFQRARDATLAAAAAQRALARHPWPDGVQVSVRMGIHSGDPEVAGDRYVGLAVSRAARICAAGHGGQVLLSSAARALIGDDGGTTVRTLGSYRLKDFPAPEPISQLEIEGLPRRFPPLRTGAKRPRRKRLVLAAAAALALIAAIAGSWAAFAGHSSNVTLGPTELGVIDAKTNKLVKAIPLGFRSTLIAAGEGYVWVADPDGSTLVRIDPRTLETRTFGTGLGARPNGLAVGHSSVWLAVVRGRQHAVLELDPQFALPRGPEIAAGGLLATGPDAVWAVDRETGALTRIDPQTGKPRVLGVGFLASGIAATSDAVWVAGPPLIKIDPVTGTPDTTQILAKPGDVGSVATGFGGAWFTTSAETSLWRIDLQTNSVTNHTSVGRGPSAVATGEGAVWVTNSRDGSVTRIDPQNPTHTKKIPTGSAPGGIVAKYGKVWVTSDRVRG